MFNYNKIEELYPQAGELMWEPMLCWKLPKGKENKLEEVCSSGEYFGSLKKDGAFYQIVKTQDYCYLFGRTISKVTGLLTEKMDNVPHLRQAFDSLPVNTVIVTEIYYPGKTSKDTVTIMGCLPKLAIKRQENNPIHAYIHDILMYDGVDLRKVEALTRYKILEAIWKKHNLSAFDYLELAQPVYENIYEAVNDALARGEEGMVLRKKTAPWTCGKRPAWDTIKVKQFCEADFVCMGMEPATKEYTGKEIEKWPYWENIKSQALNKDGQVMLEFNDWIPVTKSYYYGWPGAIDIGAYDDDGKLVKLGTVSSGLTDADKEDMFNNPDKYIGTVANFSGMSLDNKEHTLRHPRFTCWRFDKNPEECIIKEIFA